MKLNRSFFHSIGILLVGICLHFGFENFVLNSQHHYFQSIYLFTFLMLVITLLILEFLSVKFKEYLGYLFLFIVVLKLVAAKIFMNSIDGWQEKEFKFSFLILYLLSLILITRFAAKKLGKEES